MVLPNYLKMFRKRSGLSQREVAFLLGCRHGSKVSRYERGERVPNAQTVFGYEAIFRVPSKQLFRGLAEATADQVRHRTRRLMRQLDQQARTPAVKHKVEFLVDVAYQRPAGPSQPNKA